MARPKKTRNYDAFLKALASGLSVTGAAAASRVDIRTLYRDREGDAALKASWDAAVEQGTDALEDEALRRASQGVDKPIFYKGELVTTVREYSDTLAIFLLKGRRPEKFKDRAQVDLGATDGLVAALQAAEKRVKT